MTTYVGLDAAAFADWTTAVPCPACRGVGAYKDWRCQRCNASGLVLACSVRSLSLGVRLTEAATVWFVVGVCGFCFDLIGTHTGPERATCIVDCRNNDQDDIIPTVVASAVIEKVEAWSSPPFRDDLHYRTSFGPLDVLPEPLTDIECRVAGCNVPGTRGPRLWHGDWDGYRCPTDGRVPVPALTSGEVVEL